MQALRDEAEAKADSVAQLEAEGSKVTADAKTSQKNGHAFDLVFSSAPAASRHGSRASYQSNRDVSCQHIKHVECHSKQWIPEACI